MIFVSGCSRNLQFRQMCLPPVLILLADSHKSQWTPWLMPVWGVGNASQPCDRLTVGYPRVGQPVRKSSGYLWKKKKKKKRLLYMANHKLSNLQAYAYGINNCWNMRHKASHWKIITNTGKPLWRRHLLFPQVHTDLFTSENIHTVFQMGWFLKSQFSNLQSATPKH